MPNWFDAIERGQFGKVIDLFNQTQFCDELKQPVLAPARGRICVPLSTLWIRYLFDDKRSCKTFKDYVPVGNSCPILAHLHLILSSMDKAVDTPLDERFARGRSLYAFSVILNNYKRRLKNGVMDPEHKETFLKSVSDDVLRIMRTRDEEKFVWPSELFTEKEYGAWVAFLNSIFTVVPPRIEPCERLIAHEFLDVSLKIYTFGKFNSVTTRMFVAVEDVMQLMSAHEGSLTLTLFNKTVVDDEWKSFRGHMMALQLSKTDALFFDPNCGAAHFPTRQKFLDWFAQSWRGQYGERFGSGAFVKLLEYDANVSA